MSFFNDIKVLIVLDIIYGVMFIVKCRIFNKEIVIKVIFGERKWVSIEYTYISNVNIEILN